MESLKRRDAQNIATKLGLPIDKSSRGHDKVLVRINGQVVGRYGIRRGKRSGHNYLPGQLGLSLSETAQLSRCQMSREQYVQHLEEAGKLTKPADSP